MKKGIDYVLVSAVGFLLTIGLIVIASVSSDISIKVSGSPYYYLFRHLLHIMIGLILGYLAFKIKLETVKKYSLFLLLGNLFLFLLIFRFGFSAGGATRWLDLGVLTFQPSELIKLTLLIYLCAWLAKIRETKKKAQSSRSVLICFSFFLVSLLFLYLQKDLSTISVLFAIVFIVYFLSQAPYLNLLALFLFGLSGIIYMIKKTPYRMERVFTLLNPEADPLGKGYQIYQALIAIGSGGFLGLGLGMSRQKLGFLPESMTDAIFPIFNEEAGFVGGVLIILLFLTFLWAGITISKKSNDCFSYLLASGITVWIITQAFVNIGAMTRIIPLTGITLPFMSYGGSHIVAELIGIGLLLNISKNKT
jgi:cell division protein FtsW